MKKTIALVLCLALCIAMLAGCGSSTASESASESPAESESAAVSEEASQTESESAQSEEATEPETSEESAEESEPAEEAAEETAEETEAAASTATISYPLEGENLELDYWLPFYSFIWTGYFDSFEDAPITPVLEEKTGVHINFHEVSGESVDETFNLMLISDDLPDIFALTSSMTMESMYVGGATRAEEEGIIIDMTDLLEEHAPDYYRVITSMDEYTQRYLFTEDGRVLQFYQLDDQSILESGLGIRTDWAEALGYDNIETIDEFTAFLKDAKAAYDPEYTLWLDTDAIAENIIGAFGTVGYQLDGEDILWQQTDGVLEAGCATDGYRQYLEWLIELYDEGIINQDFYSDSEDREQSTVVADGDIAAIPYVSSNVIDDIMNAYTDPDATFDGHAPIVAEAGGSYTYMELTSALGRNTMVISTACEDPAMAMEYLNYGYTDEGSIVSNYGEEGVTFEFGENGEPQYTEYITNNPDHSPMSIRNTINAVYTPFLYFKDAMFFTYSDRALAAMTDEVWGKGTSENSVPTSSNLSFTSEEATEYSAIVSDLATYISEQVGKWIIGSEELTDESWQEYLDNLDKMNLAELTEIAQSGYDAFWGLK